MTSCAYTHSLFLDETGSVWSCGGNNYGQLGRGDTVDINAAQKIIELPPIVAACAGYDFSLFLDADGSVWSCGNNNRGQLATGNNTNRSKAERIAGIPKITSILALNFSPFFLDVEGFVWSCGYNDQGQLGSGDTTSKSKAGKVAGLPAIKSMAGGSYHSLFLDFEGSVWSCGYNGYGQLGLGDTTNRSKAEKVAGLPRIIKISACYNHSHFIDEGGSVWVCGSNGSGELGLGHSTAQNKAVRNDRLVNIVAASGGHSCSMFLDKDGNIFTCGSNQDGQLGLGDKTNRNIPEKVNNIPKISSLFTGCSSYHLQVVDWEGSVWSCGKNQNGQLGLGDRNQRKYFEKVRDIRIKQQHVGKNVEKEMFQSLASEQSKEVKETMERARMTSKLSKEQVRENMVLGVIPMADWASKWNPIYEKSHKAKLSIAEHQAALSQKQQQLAKLSKEIEEIQQGLAGMVEDNETWQYFDEFLEPLVEVENELKSAFEEKVNAGKFAEFSVDDFSLFLNVCGIEALVPFQRENQFKGEELVFAFSDISVLEIKDDLQQKKVKFYLKVLEAGKLLKGKELAKSVIWRHREVEKTLLLLREWDIRLDEELIRKEKISICQLIFFKLKNLKMFGLDKKEGMQTCAKLESLRKEFEAFLK